MIEDYTHIVLVADRSGSMYSIRDDAEGGINSFIAKNKEFEKGIATFSLYDFDTVYRNVFGPRDIKQFTSYTLNPGGGTALYDAVGRAISDTNLFINSTPEALRPGKIIFVIVTDGQENSSREYNKQNLKSLISASREKGWEFVFLAGDQDAMFAGGEIGISYTTSFVNTGASARAAYGSVTDTVLGYRTNNTVTIASNIDAEGNAV